jgi:hypothetical protein
MGFPIFRSRGQVRECQGRRDVVLDPRFNRRETGVGVLGLLPTYQEPLSQSFDSFRADLNSGRSIPSFRSSLLVFL